MSSLKHIALLAGALCAFADASMVEGTPAGDVKFCGSNADGFVVDTCAVHGIAFRWQSNPSVAFDGANYLVVWEDARTGDDDIFGARLTQSGEVLDTVGFCISMTARTQCAPAVAFDGSNYLVAWVDSRNGLPDIYGARVTPQGIVLDPQGFRISQGDSSECSVSLAFDGTNFLVVWFEGSAGYYDVYGARVTPAGAILDPTGVCISRAAGSQEHPVVAFDGTNYLVVWESDVDRRHDICGARMTTDGVVLDTQGIAISHAAYIQEAPSLAFDGDNYLVVWHALLNDDCNIYGSRVAPQGTVMDTQDIPISTATRYQKYPAIAFDGLNFLVLWSDTRNSLTRADIYAARVTRPGIVLDPDGLPVSRAVEGQGSPAIICGDSGLLATWTDGRYTTPSGNTEIYCARLNSAGAVLDPDGLLLSSSAHRQSLPASASVRSSCLAMWQEERANEYSLRGTVFLPDGRLPAGRSFLVSELDGEFWAAAIGAGETSYLAAWQDYREGNWHVYATIISEDGVVLAPGGFRVTPDTGTQVLPAVAFDGTNFLVVWSDARAKNLRGTRVSQDGEVIDPHGFGVPPAGHSSGSPAIAYDGENYLVVISHAVNDGRLYGARVTPGGVVLDSLGFVIVPSVGYWSLTPRLAFGGSATDTGGCYMLTWAGGGFDGPDIRGARITPQGVVLDTQGFAIATGSQSQMSPTVTFDGTDFIVAWEEVRDGFYADICGARVTLAGNVVDRGPLVTDEGSQHYPDLTMGPSGSLVLTYSGWTTSFRGTAYNSYRTWCLADPRPSIVSGKSPDARRPNFKSTILRGSVYLDWPTTAAGRSLLLDATGRRVLGLRPGRNDLSRLPAGIYFIRRDGERETAKVVITR